MRIIGPPSASQQRVTARCATWVAAGQGDAVFTAAMLPVLWRRAVQYTVDPVGVVAQSWKETAGGKFTGVISARWFNTCGLKVRFEDLLPGSTDGERPLAHQMFPNWDVGALAHVQHVRAYAGWPPPSVDVLVDPRAVYVSGPGCETWAELGGRWAPSVTYGAEVEALMGQLHAG